MYSKLQKKNQRTTRQNFYIWTQFRFVLSEWFSQNEIKLATNSYAQQFLLPDLIAFFSILFHIFIFIRPFISCYMKMRSKIKAKPNQQQEKSNNKKNQSNEFNKEKDRTKRVYWILSELPPFGSECIAKCSDEWIHFFRLILFFCLSLSFFVTVVVFHQHAGRQLKERSAYTLCHIQLATLQVISARNKLTKIQIHIHMWN